MGTPVTSAGAMAVEWALAQIGTPYIWGGESPGVGFDCSGLVQAAYQDRRRRAPPSRAGPVRRHAEADGRSAARTRRPRLLRRPGPGAIDHVGIYAGVVNGAAVMVDTPHTGADVVSRSSPPTSAALGGLVFVGATRP